MLGRRVARRLVATACALGAALALAGCEPPLCTTLDATLGAPGCGEGATLNSPPVIEEIRSTSLTPQLEERVEFSAGVRDPDHDQIYYEWDLDGDGDFDRAGYAETARTVETHYHAAGVVHLKLRVSDFPNLPGGEGQDSATKRFRVHTRAQFNADRPPVAAFTITPNPVGEGEPVSFDASGSSDPDHDRLYFIWRSPDDPNFRSEGNSPRLAFRAGSAGMFDVQLRAMDEYGKDSSSTHTLTIEGGPAAPHAELDIDPNPARSGQTVNFSAARSTDSNGDIDHYEWDVDRQPGYELTTTGPSTSKQYGEPGQFNVGVRVVDATGRVSGLTRQMVVNSSTAPGGTRGGVRIARLGSRRAFSARLTGRSGGGGKSVIAGSGRLRASLYGPRRLTRAERGLKRFLSATWRTSLHVTVHKHAGTAAVKGFALAVPARGRQRACVRLTISVRAGKLPRGTFKVVGGTASAARLHGTGAFRFKVAGKGPARIVGTLRAGQGRAHGLPRACARLQPH
jgi:hypothetical protein